MFSPDESESSRGADEEQGTENSNSTKSFETKEGDVDSSLPESHTSFEYGQGDHFAHTFSLSPFTRLNFAFDSELGHGHSHDALAVKTVEMREEDLPIAPVFDPNAHYGSEIHTSQVEDSHEEKQQRESTVREEAPLAEPIRKRSRRVTRPSAKAVRKSHGKGETKVFSSARDEPSLSFMSEPVSRPISKPREQRTFNCTTCKATFNRQSHLERHNLSHTGERPFPCAIDGCGKAFTRKEHLKRHIDNTHASSTPCICTKCDKALKDPWSLRKHLKAKHADE